MFSDLSQLSPIGSFDDVNRALKLWKIVHSNGIDFDVLNVDQFLFTCYAKIIGQIWSKLPETEQKELISQSAKLLV